MDGWIDEMVDQGWMNELTKEKMNEWVYYGCMDKWMDG